MYLMCFHSLKKCLVEICLFNMEKTGLLAAVVSFWLKIKKIIEIYKYSKFPFKLLLNGPLYSSFKILISI